MLRGKLIFSMLLSAIIFWVVIGSFIIIGSYFLFEDTADYTAYDITQAQIIKPPRPNAKLPIIADAARGKVIFQQCMVCHSLGAEDSPGIGPNLSHIVGRTIAAEKNFYYSAAMKEFSKGHKVWTLALLDKYLAEPQAVVPGNRMGFQGVTEEKNRADLLLYLSKAAKLQ